MLNTYYIHEVHVSHDTWLEYRYTAPSPRKTIIQYISWYEEFWEDIWLVSWWSVQGLTPMNILNGISSFCWACSVESWTFLWVIYLSTWITWQKDIAIFNDWWKEETNDEWHFRDSEGPGDLWKVAVLGWFHFSGREDVTADDRDYHVMSSSEGKPCAPLSEGYSAHYLHCLQYIVDL